MSYTKGPLRVVKLQDHRYLPGHYAIAHDEKGIIGAGSENDCRLWAAAEKLLEACEAAVEFVQNDRFTSGNDPACNCNGCRTIRVLKAAIAKATVTEAEVGR